MIKLIDKYLVKVSPSLHRYVKKRFNAYKKKYSPRLTKEAFVAILEDDLKIKKGDVLFIHASMRRLYLDFPKYEIMPILQESVGEEGTLLFPCWQFNTRAETYINENEIVFSYRDSPSAMGKLSDVLRSHPNACRSFHPTNSVIAIGRHAQELTQGHEDDIYPCGVHSPLYKMMKYKAKVLGIGVTVDNLTFVHVIEDTIKDKFPVKTRSDEIYNCTCIDRDGHQKTIHTLVATKAVSNRDVTAFFEREIPQEICTRITRQGMSFFSSETPQLYEKIKECAGRNQTIYL